MSRTVKHLGQGRTQETKKTIIRTRLEILIPFKLSQLLTVYPSQRIIMVWRKISNPHYKTWIKLLGKVQITSKERIQVGIMLESMTVNHRPYPSLHLIIRRKITTISRVTMV